MIRLSKTWVFLIAQVVLLLAMVGIVPARMYGLRPEASFPNLRPEPRSVGPLYDVPEMISDTELREVLERLVPRFAGAKPRTNHVDHALRFWGADAEFNDEGCLSGAAMRDLLLNHRRFAESWGSSEKPLLVDSENGVVVRVEPSLSAASHVDHTIASLAEVGTPLDFPVTTPVGSTDYRALIQASLRNFSLNQVEHEWSALTYALMLQATDKWMTREGQEISFDRLAERSMRQVLQQGVCYGNHRLHELVVLLRVDDQEKILSETMRSKIVSYLQAVSQLLARTQHPEGYWDGLWTGLGTQTPEQNLPDGELSEKIIVTGHVLEWLALAPAEVQPSTEVKVRASRWLVNTILEMSSEQIQANFPYLSHAGRALALWRGQTPAQVLRSGNTKP